MLECLSGGVLECLSGGVLECLSGGVLECLNGGVVKFGRLVLLYRVKSFFAQAKTAVLWKIYQMNLASLFHAVATNACNVPPGRKAFPLRSHLRHQTRLHRRRTTPQPTLRMCQPNR